MGSSPVTATIPSSSSGLDRARARVCDHLAATLARLDVADGARCLAAYSGGGDSTALLVALRDAGRTALAVHVDHRMDGGSGDRAIQAAAIAAQLGVPCLSLAVDVPRLRRRSESVEAAARRLRYAALEQAADRAEADWILTAHHREDQAETVLLRILFGSGLLGLAAIQERRGRILRPLLDLSRQELRDAVSNAGIAFVSDPTNQDLRWPRNRIRHLMLPAMRQSEAAIDERLAAVARAALAARRRLASAAPPLASAAPPPNPAPPFSYTFEMPGSISLQALGLRLHLQPSEWQPWMAAGDRHRAALALGSDASGATAVVRSRRPGDRLRPLGGPGGRKLKELLIDRKVPRAERDRLPLLVLGGRIAWVPGVTISEEFRCRPGDPVWLARLEPAGE